MAEMVASTLVQEGVSGVSSYVSRKLEEKVSTAHMMARLEMALSQLEFALERTGKMPITYVSLLRRRKMLQQAYIEGTDLLNKHMLQSLEGHKEIEKLVTTGSSFFERVKLSISSLIGLNKGYLISSDIKIFEWYADCAAKFVRDVESCNPLLYNSFCYPLVRQLLEGKNLSYEVVKGNRAYVLSSRPVHLEDRGIEAWLEYIYVDMERQEQCFSLGLMLRLSEDTDILGITIKCLQLLTSQFKFVTESAIGELTLVTYLQDISRMDAHPMSRLEKYANFTKVLRPDPICCANDIVSSKSLLEFPEPVIAANFEYMLHSSGDGADRKKAPPPLYLTAAFVPHICATQQGFIMKCGATEQHISGSIQQIEEILRSKAIDCVLHQPGPTDYLMSWYSMHGIALITLRKPSNKQACLKPISTLRHRRAILEYGDGSIETTEVKSKSNALDSVIHQLEPTHYVVKWCCRDIVACVTLRESAWITMREPNNEVACPKPTAARSSCRSGAKRKR